VCGGCVWWLCVPFMRYLVSVGFLRRNLCTELQNSYPRLKSIPNSKNFQEQFVDDTIKNESNGQYLPRNND
jgi:hypothetical protein